MSVVHIAAVSQDWNLIIQLAHAIGFMDRIPDKSISQFYQLRGQRIYDCVPLNSVCQYLSDIVADQYSLLNIQIRTLLERKYQDTRTPSISRPALAVSKLPEHFTN